MTVLNYSTTLTKLECGDCSIPFAMPTNLHDAALQDGRWFWCPNGHRIHYTETKNAELTNQLEAEKRRRVQAEARTDQARAEVEHQRRRAAAYKGQITKARRRFTHGVCPVEGCRRHFDNLGAHMASKHADLVVTA